jgi:hypothetical protein
MDACGCNEPLWPSQSTIIIFVTSLDSMSKMLTTWPWRLSKADCKWQTKVDSSDEVQVVEQGTPRGTDKAKEAE